MPEPEDDAHEPSRNVGSDAGDARAAKRRRIKQFWEGVKVPDGPRDADMAKRIGGLTGEPPRSDAEWDLHVQWKRTDQGEQRSLGTGTAEKVAAILARAREAMRRPAGRASTNRTPDRPSETDQGEGIKKDDSAA